MEEDLSQLEKYGLRAHFQDPVEYFGHVINKEGIHQKKFVSHHQSQLPDLALMTALPFNNTSQTSSPMPVSPSPDNSLQSLSTHRDNRRKTYLYNNNNAKNRDVLGQRL